MAPLKPPQKRRRSSEISTFHSQDRGRPRPDSWRASSQLNYRSGSRSSQGSRVSSSHSSYAPDRGRGTVRRASERPQSAASSRSFGEDDRNEAAPPRRQEHSEDDMELLSEVIMAVNLTEKGTVGCAYYVARDEKLYFMEDVQMGGPDVIDACKLRI